MNQNSHPANVVILNPLFAIEMKYLLNGSTFFVCDGKLCRLNYTLESEPKNIIDCEGRDLILIGHDERSANLCIRREDEGEYIAAQSKIRELLNQFDFLGAYNAYREWASKKTRDKHKVEELREDIKKRDCNH